MRVTGAQWFWVTSSDVICRLRRRRWCDVRGMQYNVMHIRRTVRGVDLKPCRFNETRNPSYWFVLIEIFQTKLISSLNFRVSIFFRVRFKTLFKVKFCKKTNVSIFISSWWFGVDGFRYFFRRTKCLFLSKRYVYLFHRSDISTHWYFRKSFYYVKSFTYVRKYLPKNRMKTIFFSVTRFS